MDSVASDFYDFLVGYQEGDDKLDPIILNDKGESEFTSANTSVGKMPLKPINFTTLYDIGGEMQNPALGLDHSSLQFKVRSVKYDEGWDRTHKLYNAFNGLPPRNKGDFRYVSSIAMTDGSFVGVDENQYYCFTLTLNVIRTPMDAGNRQTLGRTGDE